LITENMACNKKAAVALSGGIDSSFCAHLLSQQGYELIGLTLKIPFFDEDHIERAKYVCYKLNIPHRTIDISGAFNKHIIEYFVDSYLKGLTPNPCCVCNRIFKFGILQQEAQQNGYSYLATGHYAHIVKEQEEFYLTKGTFESKSQEYFLGLVPKEKFRNILLPLGRYCKDEVKNKIQEAGIYPFDVHESQEICFIKDRSRYREFIESYIPDSYKYSGIIRYRNGRVLGKHKGIYSFTYGQREKLGISWHKPLYVLDLDPATKEVIVGEKEFVFKDKFVVGSMNWFYPQNNYDNLDVKIRYDSSFLPCKIKEIDKDRVLCTLKGSRDTPSPGQLAVFYDEDRVVAGGWIEKEHFL